MPNPPQREPYFSQANVHTRSPTTPNYTIFGVLVFLEHINIIAKELE